MKSKALAVIVVIVMVAVFASAQDKPDASQGAGHAQDPLVFVKLAANVAGGLHPIDGYIAIYIDQNTWSAGLKDSDLGPFVKFKDAKPGRSMACLFSQSKNVITCVYFDADKPFGVVSVLAHVNGSITSSDVSAAYEKFSKDMLQGSNGPSISFTPSDINSDDGTKLIAYLISNPTKSKN